MPPGSAAGPLTACPHCAVVFDDGVHVCADHDRWTNEERDAMREHLAVKYPNVRHRRVDETVGRGRMPRIPNIAASDQKLNCDGES